MQVITLSSTITAELLQKNETLELILPAKYRVRSTYARMLKKRYSKRGLNKGLALSGLLGILSLNNSIANEEK